MAADEELPTATWEGEFMLMGVRIRAYVVNGKRIINADDFHQWLEVLNGNAEIPDNLQEEISRFVRWHAE